MSLVLGIDASRCRSGGAKSHLIGFLNCVQPNDFSCSKIHLWSYNELLKEIDDKPWLCKHSHNLIERSLLSQLFWQFVLLPKSAETLKCDLVLNLDAGSISTFKPSITMSRDMLSYEPNVAKLFGWSPARLRLEILRFVQNSSLKNANGRIFLTNYAKKTIEKSYWPKVPSKVIPHGVGENFRIVPSASKIGQQRFKIVYISNTDPYKHHEEVIDALKILDSEVQNKFLEVYFVGSPGWSHKKILKKLIHLEMRNIKLELKGNVGHSNIPKLLSNMDIFLFASSCENMPNTLLEGMAAGKVIICSRRGPMPEVLGDSGLYFDPQNSSSIKSSLKAVIEDASLRNKLAQKAFQRSTKYSWQICATETMDFLTSIKNTS